jgi:hypothetical protein
MPYKDLKVRKTKQAGYSKKHYEGNKQQVKKSVADRKRDLAKWFREYKATLGCFGCDENDPACLEFHHVITTNKRNRTDSANEWVHHRVWSKERILKELWATCVPLCSNCHRKVHRMARDLEKAKT